MKRHSEALIIANTVIKTTQRAQLRSENQKKNYVTVVLKTCFYSRDTSPLILVHLKTNTIKLLFRFTFFFHMY